ncbi:MAG: YpdA family putative bacillithiol disulfide reductase [Gemmatimonadales bacterium]|nr:MAG: YpdA family putative bacillithiol disulfide reductase [Gemmatimonadales bacterium]
MAEAVTTPASSPSVAPAAGPESDTVDLAVDLAVIGAGPCGIAVGAAAHRAGLSSVLVDRGPLCAAIVGYPWYMQFFSTPEKLEIEGLPFVTAEKNATRREALTYYRRVAEYFELDTRLYEDVEAVEGKAGEFRLRTRRQGEAPGDAAERTLRARNVVVATGGFHAPNLLGVPGEDLPQVSHHYREPHPYWRRDVVVVGGSNSAVEASLELFRAGARVTLVHFLHDFDRGVKPWVLPDIRNRVEKGEVAVRWGHRVEEIAPGRVVLRDEATGVLETLPNDHVLALTGWRSDPSLLRSLSVDIDAETGVPAHDPGTMETPVPGVFIAGVLAAGNDANRIFIENGRWHGRSIVQAIAGRPGSGTGSGSGAEDVREGASPAAR